MPPFYSQDMDLSRYNVLAVDDVPLNLILIQKMLSKFNFNVITADNGARALASIKEKQPDLLLLDILMPEMDGFEVLRRLRENPEYDTLKIVILSALNSTEDIVKGYQLGANDFITKPIILEKLVNCVATQLQIIKK